MQIAREVWLLRGLVLAVSMARVCVTGASDLIAAVQAGLDGVL